ncbi:unnamed protein product [Schistosoma curassoni]|uniref:Uncharacterized protein n=1 Tax=Schistosoma curassoni TaxID=6186 RepID=A0A183L091_9TREM|nr:unnamed protein product [Schistosoma curassoni]
MYDMLDKVHVQKAIELVDTAYLFVLKQTNVLNILNTITVYNNIYRIDYYLMIDYY